MQSVEDIGRTLRMALVFPPQANPTYVPLGVAQLAAQVRRLTGRADTVRVLDLNVQLWETLASRSPEGRELLAFVRGQRGDFFDEAAYAAGLASWGVPARAMAELTGQARRWLASDEPAAPELAALLDEQVAAVLATRPDRVGLSILYPSQLVFALALARRLAGAPSTAWGDGLAGAPGEGDGPRLRVLLGGAALSTIKVDELLAACPFVDGAVLGEGEAAMAALVRESFPARVPGLARLGAGGALVEQPAAAPQPLAALVPPDFSDLDLSRYFSPLPVLPAVSSRGCRWRRCRFCAHNFSFGAYRQLEVGRFVDELQQQHRLHGVRHFYLADQYVEAADLGALADELLRRGLDFHWHVMGRPTPDYDEALCAKLAAGGCRWISWGVETGSQRLIDVAGKGTEVEQTKLVLQRTAAAGISSLPMMLFGLPTGTDEDLAQTFALLEEVYDGIEAMTSSSFVLYDHTPFGRHPERYGMEVTGREEMLSVGGLPIHSERLLYREVSSDGSLRPPRGNIEVAEWEQRRRWLGGKSLYDNLFAEHYLLLVAARHERRRALGGEAVTSRSPAA